MKAKKRDMGRENALGFQHHDRTDAPGKGGGEGRRISAKLPRIWTDYGRYSVHLVDDVRWHLDDPNKGRNT